MQEKKLKEALIEEKNNLSTELEKQIRFNTQLQDNSSGNAEASSRLTVSNFKFIILSTVFLKLKMIVLLLEQ